MKRFCLFLTGCLFCLPILFAGKVVIKAPDYFTDPIRDGYSLFPDSLVFDENAEEIHIPDVGTIGKLGNYNFPNLKKVTFGNVDYLPGGLFNGMPQLEEVVFEGRIGHFDCSMALDCPKLRKITFKGPVSSTGGPALGYNLANLDSVIFESVVVNFGLENDSTHKCPKVKFINNGAFLNVENESQTPSATFEQIKNDRRLVEALELLADWQSEVLRAKNPKWMRRVEFSSAKALLPVLEKLKSAKAHSLKEAMEYAWNLGDEVKTKLEILKESPDYFAGNAPGIEFRYASRADSNLTATRTKFNLDSIAGSGDDVSRIKNLMYWIHNTIPHNGSNGLAPGERTLANTVESSRRNSCGYNCRALAICLTEALLAEGIPARYLTCVPKDWENDNDCHVICVAWSESLEKWIWVDPTFAAYVTDENGLLLHPGEVRDRLRRGLPLNLNSDANWNNRVKQTKDYYLENYMAKNLYLIEANVYNRYNPEGKTATAMGPYVMLVPRNVKYSNTHYTTSDEQWFWQPPVKQ